MLKTLSGAAMLFFLLALLMALLERMGVVRKQTTLSLMKTVLICLCFFLAYEAAARVIYFLLYGGETAPGPQEIFGVRQLEPYFAGLESGAGLWNLPGHFLGKLLFGEYQMGGMVFSTALVVAAMHLCYLRLRAKHEEHGARTGQALLLTFPGVFFCFLPGWGAWALLAAALAFYFIGKRVRVRAGLSAPAAEVLFAVMGVLNAMLLMLTVMRKFG